MGAQLGVIGAFYWYEFNGSGYTETPITTTIGNPASVKMIDLDNDNLNDIVLSSGTIGAGSDLAWFKNQGAGNFSAENIIDATQSQAYVFTVADFDNDGDLDIVSGAFNQNDLNYFENELFTLSVNNESIQKVSVFPNPVNNVIYVKGLPNTSESATVFNQIGQQIFKGFLDENNALNTTDYASGIYFIQLTDSNMVFKFVKQ